MDDVEKASERLRGKRLLEALGAVAPDERMTALVMEDRFLSWGLVEALCEESRRAAHADPEECLAWAELADLLTQQLMAALLRRFQGVVSELAPEVDSRQALEEWADQLSRETIEAAWRAAQRHVCGVLTVSELPALRALALAHLANAQRVAGDLHRAASLMREALGQWPNGEAWEDDCIGAEPRVLCLLASLRADQRRLPEALEALDEVETYYRLEHLSVTPIQWAQLWVRRSFVQIELGEFQEALSVLDQAAVALEPYRSEQAELWRGLQHNRAWCWATLGDVAASEAAMEQLQDHRGGGLLSRARQRWLDGRLAVAQGKNRVASLAFEEVRKTFIDAGIGYDAALVTLELALLYVKRGQWKKTQRLASEILPIFQSLDISRESLVALGVFLAAAAQDRVTVPLVRHVHDFVLRARGNPRLNYAPLAEET